MKKTLILVATLHLVGSSAQGQAVPAPLTAHRTGQFEAVLPDRSPWSEASRWAERFQFRGSLDAYDYDLSTESFSFYVPPDYAPEGEPYGVLVWVSAFDSGTMPPAFREALDERRLIWIGPNNAGNSRHLYPREGLALDAAANAGAFYHIDPDRVFVSGLSGGGKVAAMLAVDYSDVFSGGFPIIGVTTYLDVPIPSSPGQLVLRFARPSADLVERAKRQPLVILTGSGDFNREECRLTAAAYERDGFTDLHLLDIEGMGHEMPSAENFAAGLDLLLTPSAGR
jgi:hypothetical protein